MSRTSRIVKTNKLVPLALFAAFAGVFLCGAVRAGEQFPKPHMLYFYNPSCRLCTATNEVVGAIETKYKDKLSHQRFNIADQDEGTDNVLYMFDLMDEMKVPEENETTLVVFVGLLEKDGDEVFFTPKRVLVEGEEIAEKLDETVREFLDSTGEGGVSSAGVVRSPASFFLEHGLGRDAGS
ncbi:MAG: hypothetical protein LBS30_01200 [Planctomycetota bacterium]|jgi:hypothetical protein|nr:hypothetical protein [Planctomycetota bacterium]